MSGVRPWVAYVGPFPYPAGSAASRRVLGMAQSIAQSGLDVVVASGAGSSEAEAGVLVPQGDGIAYCLLPERTAEHWPRPLRRFRYAWMGARTVAWLASRPSLPQAVVLYSGYTPYLQRLLPWCRRNGVRLLFDAVEWYEPAHPSGYITSPYQWNIEWAMRQLVPKVDGVIAISRYLAEYYRDCGLPVAIVPPTTSEIAEGAWQPSNRLRLAFAGAPGHVDGLGHKDDLAVVLSCVANLAARGAPIHLTIAGPHPSAVHRMLDPNQSDHDSWLSTPGCLNRMEVQSLLGLSDFTILIRQKNRLNTAGFPTKFVESFACGTPVIANLTSDLHLHLRDGETGLVC
ncbi:glycosyltransferase, partial [Thermomonas sp.]|uniref:glycosyltransferase n=1 Tax=Thermomonas sp. TaxID=1971895 RepID=UPI0035B46F93